MNFALVGFIDTFEFVASLRSRMGMFKPDPEVDEHLATIPVRALKLGGGLAYIGSVVQKWPELRAVLQQLERMGKERLPGFEFGRLGLTVLSPGGTLPWVAPKLSEWSRCQVAIRTNPGAMVFAGTEAQRLLPGDIVVVNHRVPCSMVNLGEWPVVHLVCEFRTTITND